MRAAIWRLIGLVVAGGLALNLVAQEYLPDIPLDHPAIRYFESPTTNRVAKLDAAIRSGSVQIPHSGGTFGYLPGLLKALEAPEESQALVFSKTSFQAPKISPQNPRAIYFGDDTAVAYIRGVDEIEIASTDPVLGTVFYTGNIQKLGKDGFTRGQVCVKCHQGPATSGVPGMFVGSVFPGPLGQPSPVEAIITDHRTEFKDRWGGWYINAKKGQQVDRSNGVASNPALPEELDENRGQNLTHLFGKVNTDGYLRPVSDMVALMTFEHQTQMANYITRIGWEARTAAHAGKVDEITRATMDKNIETMLTYMLFLDEVPLPEPIEGVSAFTKVFAERAPRDRKGRSLRDFDLQRRLFRYPLSYMIYSPAFDALPATVRDHIYQRLYDILTGKTPDGKFANIAAADRQDILEILRDTKSGLPGYWTPPTP